MEVCSEIGKKIKYLQASKERVRMCKDYIIGREITTVLKIAVDSVILELCELHDYFVSPLLVEKPIKFNHDF